MRRRSRERPANRTGSARDDRRTTVSRPPATCGRSPRSDTTRLHALTINDVATSATDHVAALRNLFNKLTGKLHHCLATGQIYNPDIAFTHTAAAAA